ncbi:hypothetical protein BZA70DRAFT_253775 [Myxozyma melibiosi]|uniref:Pheromone-regulated membrane protein 10 n=1 Tax=Myxozyma melibiosi TaxID=54550 RepID=A0ABR1FDE6_9ASCO
MADGPPSSAETPSPPSSAISTPPAERARARTRPPPLPLRSSLAPRSRSHSRERGVSPGPLRSPNLRVRFPVDNNPNEVHYPNDDASDPSTLRRPGMPPRTSSAERVRTAAITFGSPEYTPNESTSSLVVPTMGSLSTHDVLVEEDEDEKPSSSGVELDDDTYRKLRYAIAQSGSRSAPNSRSTSPVREKSGHDDDNNNNNNVTQIRIEPPSPIARDDAGQTIDLEKVNRSLALDNDELTETARQLVHAHTGNLSSMETTPGEGFMVENDLNDLQSGQVTPVEHDEYVPPPSHVKNGILSSLLRLYNNHDPGANSSRVSLDTTINSHPSTPPSGRTTPTRKWYSRSANASTSSLAGLMGVGSSKKDKEEGRPSLHHSSSQGHLHGPHLSSRVRASRKHKQRLEDQIRITVHIAEVLQRQRFILKLCRALMLYGAPTHRLEEYMKMTSRVLEIDGQFLYIPGCMIVSFGDVSTHTSEMQLVRVTQGVDLGRLHLTHLIYKEVVHDIIGVEEAMQRLDEVMKAKNLYHRYLCVLIFGFSSAMVAPFAFSGRWIDMPIAFVLGCIVGFLQLVVAPRSDLYSNVFEISAAIVVSFLGRAFGSIDDVNLFCFAAVTQGALALILPGYIILCGALELQSKNIVAGAVRMFYAIIYSLFLGFGITLGAAVYGWMDHNATSRTECTTSLSPWFRFIFVPLFTIGLALVNQAHYRQIPIMVLISGCGYVVSYFSNLHFKNSSELASAIGALVIGITGNLYSRLGHGLAFAAMLPAIFVQVPSGLASQGSLISGIAVADMIVSDANVTETTITSTYVYASTTLTSYTTLTISATATATTTSADSTASMWSVGFSMIQVSIGIVVGLFVSTLVVYPLGKKRGGLFTF